MPFLIPDSEERQIFRTEPEIVTVTAKVWYVSDYAGKYIPKATIQSWGTGNDTPKHKAQAVVKENLDYFNWALANSEIPMRFVQWGSVQDIGQTEAQITSGGGDSKVVFDK